MSNNYLQIRIYVLSYAQSLFLKNYIILSQGENMFYFIAWLFFWPVRLLCRAEGLEHFYGIAGRPCIIIANHKDICDPWKIGIQMPWRYPVRWVAKEELFSFRANYRECTEDYGHAPLIAALRAIMTVVIVRFSLTIPTAREVKPGSGAAPEKRKLYRLLKQKKIIGIFPEGGIGVSSDIKSGFFKIAKTTGAVIMPVKIHDGWHVQFMPPIVPEQCSRREIAQCADNIVASTILRS